MDNRRPTRSGSEARWHLSRRELLVTTGVLVAGLACPGRGFAAPSEAALAAAQTSPLIYVSPLRSDGSESRCHAEVWFVSDASDLLVVTTAGRWRAAAIERGLRRARIWVGDHGVWTRSEGAFRQAPKLEASAAFDRSPEVRERALAGFGAKYSSEWDKWGPRFRTGLESGERVLIRYSPVG